MLLPEFRLVYLTAAGPWADASIRALLKEELDWVRVLRIAQAEHAVPVVYRRLQAVGEELDAAGAVPRLPLSGRVAQSFRRTAQVVDFRMGLLQDRMVELLAHLDEAGIPVVLLKGAGMALRWHTGLHDRPMGDLDLLIRPEDAVRAHELTQELSWELPRSDLRPHMYEGHHHLIQLDATDGMGFSVEIHTGLFPRWAPFRFGSQEVWSRAQPLARLRSSTGRPSGRPALASLPDSVHVPAPEDQLLHACLHFAWSHTFREGSWRMVRDLDALLGFPTLDAAAFLEGAATSRGESCVYWSLMLFQALTGRQPPPTFLDGLSIRSRPVLHPLLLRHLVSEALPTHPAPGTQRLSRALWTLAVDPRGSGHGAGRPWTHADRWPGPSPEEAAQMEPRPPLWTRLRGLGHYMGYLTGRRPTSEPNNP